jgi:hypothetical protein
LTGSIGDAPAPENAQEFLHGLDPKATFKVSPINGR